VSASNSLSGKVALITGGSRGIGRGISLRLAERGATVVINYRHDHAAAQDTARQVEQLGGHPHLVQADVSRPDQITHLVEQIRARGLRLDIFVHNALGNLLEFFAHR
jgi:NAD(P)-dependent dehydrogenase (short-subunit alcohol dehydrogenase family)